MLKMIFLCRRRPELAPPEYAERVLRGHAPLALEHHPTLQRYTINLVEQGAPEGPEIDSIAALYFATLDDFQRRYASPEGERIVREDVDGFLDSADVYVTREQPHKWEMLDPPLGGRTPGFKILSLLRRKRGLTHAEFASRWLRGHVPLVLQYQPALLGYVTNTVDARLSASGGDWDGFAEAYFANEEEHRIGAYASPEAERRIRADRDTFIGESHAYRVGQYVQK